MLAVTVSISEQKKQLRWQIKARLDRLGGEQRKQSSRQISARLQQLVEFHQAFNIMAFASFGQEVETGAICQAILAQGKQLVLPRMQKEVDVSGCLIHYLQLYTVQDMADTCPGPWGIPEPHPRRCALTEHAVIDLILMPGLAFDQQGGRLGYGRGYYDRLLSKWGGALPPLVALAFEAQLVPVVACDAHDKRVDAVLTEQRFLRCRNRAGPTGQSE